MILLGAGREKATETWDRFLDSLPKEWMVSSFASGTFAGFESSTA